jgi:hypothetical protein
MDYRALSGQSAIEYLMTYGWMLLVVAIAGGAIFSVVQSESIESVSGFTGGDVVVENFGLSQGGSLDFVLRNAGSEEVEINSVEVLDEEGDQAYVYPSESLGVGGSSSVSVPNVVGSSGSNSLDLRVNYDKGGLTDLSVEGSVSGGVGVEPEVWESDVDGDGSVESAEFYGSGSSVSPYRVGSVEGLQMISREPGSSFELGSDIDASGTGSWNGDSGFDPIGVNSGSSFKGTLDGNDKVISGLNINRTSQNQIGFIGWLNSQGTVRNVKMRNITVNGKEFVGGLVGVNNGGKVSSSSVKGTISGKQSGGLVGYSYGQILDSFAVANVSGPSYVGGLVGAVDGGKVEESYAYGTAENGGTVTGGLVAYNFGEISESYSMTNVSGPSYVGGLVGANYGSGKLERTYSIGKVDTSSNPGGLVAYNAGTVKHSYWNINTSNQRNSAGSSIGLETREMIGDSASGNLDGFDFQNVWRTVDGDYPELR